MTRERLPLSDDEADVAALLEAAARRVSPAVQERYEAIMRSYRRVRGVFPPGEWPPGFLVIEDGRYVELWDRNAGGVYGDGQRVHAAEVGVHGGAEGGAG